MDRGIWAIWYGLSENDKSEYIDWFHHVHIPEKLSRPGYLWAAHYQLGRDDGSLIETPPHPDATAADGGYLALFGGLTTRTFLDPSPGQLKQRQSPETRHMMGLRARTYACILAEETRLDGPALAVRGPGITPGPAIRIDNFNVDRIENEDDVGAWCIQQRLPSIASMPGCIGARKLLASVGWGRHAILCEYASLDRCRDAVPRGGPADESGNWTARVLPHLVHAPFSPAAGTRIWPQVRSDR